MLRQLICDRAYLGRFRVAEFLLCSAVLSFFVFLAGSRLCHGLVCSNFFIKLEILGRIGLQRWTFSEGMASFMGRPFCGIAVLGFRFSCRSTMERGPGVAV